MVAMRVDVLELQAFYGSRLGAVARTMVGRQLQTLWPDLTGMDVLGYGYATPWLDLWQARARRAVAYMPAAQGAERWPSQAACRVVTGDEDRTPFPDAMFDRIVLVHGLEEADAPRPLLRELWRILAPEGRLIIVATNRRGVWARIDATPFGHGRPYSRSQLLGLLGDAMFQPVAWQRALFAPPIPWKVNATAAETFEAVGNRAWPGFCGVLVVEAVKRLYAGTQVGKPGRVLLAQPAAARFAGNTAAASHKKWALQCLASSGAATLAQPPVPALQTGAHGMKTRTGQA
jgi:SAM-dependent methyltransferase